MSNLPEKTPELDVIVRQDLFGQISVVHASGEKMGEDFHPNLLVGYQILQVSSQNGTFRMRLRLPLSKTNSGA